MRIHLLLLVFLLAGSCAAAQRQTAAGYLIGIRGDTQRAVILLPRTFSLSESDGSFAQGVEVRTDSGNRSFRPGELRGFGFRQRPLMLHYHALASEEHPTRRFVRVLRTGPHLTLLAVPQLRSNKVPGLGPLRNQDVGARAGEIPRAQLYLQDAGGRVLLLDNTMGRAELRRALLEYFKDAPALRTLAVEEVHAFRDLDAFVTAANAWGR